MKSLRTYFQKMVDVPAYATLATVYDHMMNHVDYAEWADYIHTLLTRFGKNVRHVVDGGCGTGSLAFHLLKKGYQVVGFDRSLEMIRMAREKQLLPLWQGDLTAVSLSRRWDAFLCIYDSVQYLSREEVIRFFHEIRQILKPNGLFVFDVVTEGHVRKNWADFYERDRWKDMIVKRRSWYDKKNHIQHTELEISCLVSHKTYREHHRQHVWPLDTWVNMITENGFVMLGKYQDYTMHAGNDDSDRVHFVLRQERA